MGIAGRTNSVIIDEGKLLEAYTGLIRFSSKPEITLDVNTVNIAFTSAPAGISITYNIYSDNSLVGSTTGSSFDVSEYVTGTSNEHVVYVKAKAYGYLESEASNSVSWVPAKPVWSCTVANLGASNPNNVTFTHNGTMPTFEEVNVKRDVFIKIPTMYRKVNTVVDNQITSYTISEVKADDTYEPYPCFVKEDGTSVMDYILIGKYFSNSDTTCDSISTSTKLQPISTGRANARAKGTGYQIFDWMMWRLWQDLLTCKMNTVDINSGSGITYDNIGIYWSDNASVIDGIAHSDTTLILSYMPSRYVNQPTTSTSGYTQAGFSIPFSSNREISKLGYDSNNPFANLPSVVVANSSYNTYYCDVYYYSSGNCSIYTKAGTSGSIAGKPDGAFSFYGSSEWSPADVFSIRLCYRPTANVMSYQVAIDPYETVLDTVKVYYSIDNGLTWVESNSSEGSTVVSTQIKFKVEGTSDDLFDVSSETLGVITTLWTPDYTPSSVESHNYILTSDVHVSFVLIPY